MHPSSLAHSPYYIFPVFYKRKIIDFSPCVSDCFRPPNPAGLHVAHHFHSRTCRTHARPTRLDTNAPAIAPALYTTPRTPRRPARLLAPLHTPTNPAHLRRVP